MRVYRTGDFFILDQTAFLSTDVFVVQFKPKSASSLRRATRSQEANGKEKFGLLFGTTVMSSATAWQLRLGAVLIFVALFVVVPVPLLAAFTRAGTAGLQVAAPQNQDD